MPRLVTRVALIGIGSALICLPLAVFLKGGSYRTKPFNWLDIKSFHHAEAKISPEGIQLLIKQDDEENISRPFTWDGSDELTFNQSGELHFTTAPTWSLSISGPAKTLDSLSVANGRITGDGPLDVTLTGPALRTVRLNGSGEITLDRLQQDALDIEIHGSGTVHAEGRVETLKLAIAGSGDAQLEELSAQTAKVAIAGSGDADIAPLELAEISILGSGSVRLHTRPRNLSSKIQGSGELIDLSSHIKSN